MMEWALPDTSTLLSPFFFFFFLSANVTKTLTMVVFVLKKCGLYNLFSGVCNSAGLDRCIYMYTGKECFIFIYSSIEFSNIISLTSSNVNKQLMLDTIRTKNYLLCTTGLKACLYLLLIYFIGIKSQKFLKLHMKTRNITLSSKKK